MALRVDADPYCILNWGAASLPERWLSSFSLDGMQPWTKAMIFGAVSTAAIAAAYATPSPEPGFAGANFAYNITVFFPLVLLSFACWAPAIAFYVAFLRRGSHKTLLRIALPIVLLLACPFQLAVIARVLLTPLPPPPS